MAKAAARLPNTGALRAFQSVAQHLNMNKAAAELNLSQSAISQQVNGLEALLGVDLFRRLGRRLVLTEPGQRYMVHARRILDQLALASGEMREFHHCGNLTVSVCNAFAQRFLLPRFARFQQRFPEVNLRFSTSDGPVEFGAQDVDVAIRYGGGEWPGHVSAPFLGETAFPVCTTAVARKYGPFEHPGDVLRAPLLADGAARHAVTWDMWFHHVGHQAARNLNGLVFQDVSLLLQAAASGHGIALARGALVHDDLRSGALVKLFDTEIPLAQHYHIIEPRSAINRTKPNKLKQWLCDEARDMVEADEYGAVSLPAIRPEIRQPYDYEIADPRTFHPE